MKHGYLVILLFFISGTLFAAKVDTIVVQSKAMDKKVKAVVITPQIYNQANIYPVLYLLHGYSDNYATWIKRAPNVKDLCDQYNFMIVCPDGGYNSWYIDSPEDPDSQYETHIISELMPLIEQNYAVSKSKSGRAITGLSMGGHGALYLAIRHQDVFGAAGSMSGGVDLTYSVNSWEIKEKLGSYEQYPDRWHSNSISRMIDQINDDLKLIIDCGYDDFFFEINTTLHQDLLSKDKTHTFIVREGQHNWNYWPNAIIYQSLFFHRFFKGY